MFFKQFRDAETSTCTYLIACQGTRKAAIIDPVFEHGPSYLHLLNQQGLTLIYSLETHIHADHRTAADFLRTATSCQIGLSNLAPTTNADRKLSHGERLDLGALEILCLATPGHTDHDMSFHVTDRLFTGDCLFINGCGRTDFQSGSSRALWTSIMHILFSFPDETLVYPGHDYQGRWVSCIGHEKESNARVAGKSADEFYAIMEALKLPSPQKINEALPFNLRCGREC